MSKQNPGPCLIPKPSAQLPVCHEYDYCSCDLADLRAEVAELTVKLSKMADPDLYNARLAEVERLTRELSDAKGSARLNAEGFARESRRAIEALEQHEKSLDTVEKLHGMLLEREAQLEVATAALDRISVRGQEFDPPGTGRDGWEIAAQFARNARAEITAVPDRLARLEKVAEVARVTTSGYGAGCCGLNCDVIRKALSELDALEAK